MTLQSSQSRSLDHIDHGSVLLVMQCFTCKQFIKLLVFVFEYAITFFSLLIFKKKRKHF